MCRTRDHLSFRFLGIPYADFPERFTYSHVYTGTSPTSPGTNISALSFGSPCIQVGGTGNEDCLFLNIFTPLIPTSKQPKQSELKPVMFWIHGGAFTSGEGSDAIFDGGNLVSRGDVVVVTINYRCVYLLWISDIPDPCNIFCYNQPRCTWLPRPRRWCD